MIREGLCHICGKPATNTCTLCGRLVCDNDFDAPTGTCKIHKTGRKVQGRT